MLSGVNGVRTSTMKQCLIITLINPEADATVSQWKEAYLPWMPLRHYPDSLMLWCTLSGRQLVNIPIISLTVNHLTAAHLMWEGRELRIKADILNCTAGARVKQQQCSHPDDSRSPPSLTELWMNSVNLPSQKKKSHFLSLFAEQL